MLALAAAALVLASSPHAPVWLEPARELDRFTLHVADGVYEATWQDGRAVGGYERLVDGAWRRVQLAGCGTGLGALWMRPGLHPASTIARLGLPEAMGPGRYRYSLVLTRDDGVRFRVSRRFRILAAAAGRARRRHRRMGGAGRRVRPRDALGLSRACDDERDVGAAHPRVDPARRARDAPRRAR